MTRSVADSAIALQAIAGYDPNDGASQDRPAMPHLETMRKSNGRLRIGIPREFFCANLDPEVQAAFDQALAVLAKVGGETRDVALEVSADRTVLRAEAYAYHAEYIAKTPELYLPETLSKVQLGAGIDGPTYIRARRDLDRLRRSTLNVFSYVDLLVTPTTPVPAPKAVDYPSTFEGALALDGTLLRNTRPFNMYAFPTISVPCGMTRAGLPIGLQIAGPPWEEQRVLELARAFEQVTDWHTLGPPALAPMQTSERPVKTNS
jgi:aspartyl-tRNA(Asn)/glutamyl-tRNA(Gln) amidotransferase subunit A